MERKFDFVEVTLEPEKYDMIKEVYRLHKEQANKLFDLSCKIDTNEKIMNMLKDRIEYDIVLLAVDTTTGKYAGCITFHDIRIYNNVIVDVEVHPVISKLYWGKDSRKLIEDCYKFVEDNWLPLHRVTARVPSNAFGVIKLLKDVGFKVEGTLRDYYIFKDKNGNDKYYNQLIYSDINRRK